MRYAIVIEKSANGYGAYALDLPGCFALADTIEEAMRLMREAIDLHLAQMRRDGEPIPAPSTLCDYLDIQ